MPFRYFRDPLFLACVAIYFANRWALKPAFDSVFLHGYLNDLICLPIWGTVVVALTSRLRVRDPAAPPQGWELVVMLLMWSVLFEVWAPAHPYWSRWATGDPWDMLCYAAGGCGAMLFWSGYYREQKRTGDREQERRGQETRAEPIGDAPASAAVGGRPA